METEGKLVTPRPQYSQDSRSGGRESSPERDLEAGMQSSQLWAMSQPVFFLTLQNFFAILVNIFLYTDFLSAFLGVCTDGAHIVEGLY